jgi:release factor glutamine methyltransferase
MTIADWLKNSIEALKNASLPTAQLDCEILLADFLKKDRIWLHTHPEYVLQRSDLRKLDSQIKRREKHEPLAYIRGVQEFYGRNFVVSPDTLTPRPETETLVELALKILQENDVESVADIGTGSGCIIISLSLESVSKTAYTGYDISKPALDIAKKNAKILHSSAIFKKTDISKGTKHPWKNAELIVANLPYVADDFHINRAATHEPKFAIFGGKDGLDYYRHLFQKLSTKTTYVLTESLPTQHSNLVNIAESTGFKLKQSQDFIQLFVKSS